MRLGTLRRQKPAAEDSRFKEPVKVPLVQSRNEVKRIVAMALGPKARVAEARKLPNPARCGAGSSKPAKSVPNMPRIIQTSRTVSEKRAEKFFITGRSDAFERFLRVPVSNGG
ncbi:hypothetical protein K3555_04725 [Leisingera sp. M527]|uniref:hypothetical protein n=1 Tax=Leisingera sp. M527 TaxID=2867014 RepID=UPI0021A958A4|nr:hypothetical protein [Leisingera sp. M527]UWQ33816.1 hypothetical protein K3555_04725 [Leisingera sp. M527]